MDLVSVHFGPILIILNFTQVLLSEISIDFLFKYGHPSVSTPLLRDYLFSIGLI